MEHEFTKEIKSALAKRFGSKCDAIFEKSLLLQYLNIKTRSAGREWLSS